MALKSATKRIVISDESVNSHKFWVLTAGIDTSHYLQNPILLWNHNRPKTDNAKKDDLLPIGVIQNLTVEANGTVSGLPAFDDTDEFAMKIYRKYEDGIINMASAGLEPLEVDQKATKGKGKAPCLSKSILAEVSLTDIGSNRNAVKIYKDGQAVELTGADGLIKLFYSENNPDTMQTLAIKDVATLLKLADNATSHDVLEAIRKQDETIVQLTTAKTTAENELASFKRLANEQRVNDLVNGAFDLKKIKASDKPHYIKLANADYDSAKAIIDGLTPYLSLQSQLGGAEESNNLRVAELMKQDGNDLWKNGGLAELKTLSAPHYALKYKEVFKTEPPKEA